MRVYGGRKVLGFGVLLFYWLKGVGKCAYPRILRLLLVNLSISELRLRNLEPE